MIRLLAVLFAFCAFVVIVGVICVHVIMAFDGRVFNRRPPR